MRFFSGGSKTIDDSKRRNEYQIRKIAYLGL
jgi:hypothetical protein